MPLFPIGVHPDLVVMEDLQGLGCHHLFQAIHDISDVLIKIIGIVI